MRYGEPVTILIVSAVILLISWLAVPAARLFAVAYAYFHIEDREGRREFLREIQRIRKQGRA